jgi:hypothetical protein
MNLIPELEQGFDACMEVKERIVKNIQANMTFFPLCCSTGVLKGVGATEVTIHDKGYFDNPVPLAGVTEEKIRACRYIHEVISACRTVSAPIFFPVEVTRWNALSKILIKTVEGKDDGPSGGYNNYKAAQITMCDRLVADKRNPKFKFNTYNVVFSIDHLMDWLLEQYLEDNESKNIGEVYVSPAMPGGHGARVRAAIYTPDVDWLQAYHDERLQRVKDHVLWYLKRNTKTKQVVKKVKDAVAAKW